MHYHFPGAALAANTVQLGMLSQLLSFAAHILGKLFRSSWAVLPNMFGDCQQIVFRKWSPNRCTTQCARL